MNVIIVTNCTNRKRSIGDEPVVPPERLNHESVDDFAVRWIEKANQNEVKIKAKKLYCGRGYNEILVSQDKLASRLITISAGFGALLEDDTIPPYNFTFENLQRLNIDHLDWWQSINKARGKSDIVQKIVNDSSVDLILMSVSEKYLNFILEELNSLKTDTLKKIRIIIGYKPPKSVEKYTIYYDSRLDGPNSPIRGTRSDFNSRALRHFTENIILKNETNTIESHRNKVNELLDHMEYPSIPKRKKVTDEEVRSLIKAYWNESGGRSSICLRLLRDNAGVACEQSRFAKLFRQVKAK